jgi:hypothetical protein
MRAYFILCFLFLSYFLKGQTMQPVQLKSGDYWPIQIDKVDFRKEFKDQNYVILQFQSLPDVNQFHKQSGIKLLDYLPQNSFYAQIPENFEWQKLPPEVIGILKITDSMKMDPASWQNKSVAIIKLIYFETENSAEIIEKVQQKGFTVVNSFPQFQTIYVQSKQIIAPLLNIKEIYFLEPAYQKLNAFNLVERNNHRANVIGDNSRPGKGLTGKGIGIGEWDGSDVGNHEDYNSRVLFLKKKNPLIQHATHVCGTMAGAGNIDPTAKGMAPKALIYSWDFYDNITAEMDTNCGKFGFTLTQNSYAYDLVDDPCSLRGNYDLTSRELDLMLDKYPNLLHVFAAGNFRGDNCKPNGFKTVSSGFQCAKNNLAVAAVTNLDGDAGFSSCGPTRDGRIKPEVSAVGVSVYSTTINNSYQGGWNGTSMACPGASGTTALIYEYYKQKVGNLPDAHLAKNIMANSADDIGNTGPDFRHGFGRINGQRAIQILDSNWILTDSVKHKFTDTSIIKFPKGIFKAKIMLCWNDLAAAATAKSSLINDLDLWVKDSAGNIYKPWVLDTLNCSNTALRGRDSLNNIEQVTIDNPTGGQLVVFVKGTRITNSFQNYSLTWDFIKTGVSITYPNGLELMEPPSSSGKAQTIRWDSYNLSGNAKLEFSIDSGKIWQTISTSVPVTQKYFIWSNASDTLNTAKALIKITLGTFIDKSDTTFSIFKSPLSFVGVVCDSQVHIRWSKQKNAVTYKLWQIIAGEMQPIYEGKDTFFTVTKLSNGKAYWFSLSSISNYGAESQRLYAKSFTPTSSVKPPKITLDLADIAGCKNKTIVLKTTYTGSATINTAWQRSIDAGVSWKTLSGRNNDTLILTSPGFNQNAWKYRRVHYNACEGRVYTTEAKVEIDTALPYFTVPKDTIGCMDANFTLNIHNLKSVSKPTFSWIKNFNVIMDPFDYYKRGKETFLNFKNLTKDDFRFIVVSAVNGCGLTYDYDINGNIGTQLDVMDKLSIDWRDFDTICLGKVYALRPKLKGGRADWYQHTWSGAGVKSTQEWIFVKPDTSTRYFYKLNDKGCSVDSISDSLDLVVRPKLEISASNDTVICAGTSTTLVAKAKGGNGKYKFKWSHGLANASSHLVYPTKTTVYYVTLDDSCSTAKPVDSIVVSVLPKLSLTLMRNTDTICVGQSAILSAKALGGKIYQHAFLWNNNQTDSVISVGPSATRYYVVKFNDGCTNQQITDSIKINVRQPLSIKIIAPDTVCFSKIFNLNSSISGGQSITRELVWKRHGINGFSNKDSLQTGTWIKAELSDNCSSVSAIDSVWVDVWSTPKILAAKDTTLCFGQDLTFSYLQTGGKNGTVTAWWQFNKAILPNPIILDPLNSGLFNYIAMAQDGCGFRVSDTTTIRVLDKLSIKPDLFQKCSWQVISPVFTVSGGIKANTRLRWENGSSSYTRTFSENQTRIYTVTLKDGCSDSAVYSIPVVVDTFGINQFSISAVIDKTVFIRATKPMQLAHWTFGDNTSEFTQDTLLQKEFQSYADYTICRVQTDKIGCTDTSCQLVNVIDVTKTENFRIQISPNPGNGIFTLQFNQIPGDLKVEMLNSIGQKVWERTSINYQGLVFQFNPGQVANGIYLIRTTVNGEVLVHKLIVK